MQADGSFYILEVLVKRALLFGVYRLYYIKAPEFWKLPVDPLKAWQGRTDRQV